MMNDLYIEILEFGRSNLGKPISFTDLLDHLNEEGFEFEEFAVAQFFSALFIDRRQPHGNEPGSPSPQGEFFLEHNGYFNLLEHEELVSARKSATQATVFASIAIVISIFSMVASIYYSSLQLNTPARLSQAQLESLVSTIDRGALEAASSNKRIVSELAKIKNTIEEAHNKSMQPTPSAAAD